MERKTVDDHIAWGRAANARWHKEQAENRRARIGLIVWAVTVVLLLLGWLIISIVPAHAVPGVRVIDGDTLVINDVHYRIYNIDAPELHQTCTNRRGETYDCGQASKEFLQRMVVRAHGFQCHTLGLDKYKRSLAVCSVIDADGASRDVGEEMMRNGWALRFKLRIKGFKEPWDNLLMNERDPEYQAQKAGAGLWQGKFITPYEWRHRERAGAKPTQSERPDGETK